MMRRRDVNRIGVNIGTLVVCVRCARCGMNRFVQNADARYDRLVRNARLSASSCRVTRVFAANVPAIRSPHTTEAFIFVGGFCVNVEDVGNAYRRVGRNQVRPRDPAGSVSGVIPSARIRRSAATRSAPIRSLEWPSAGSRVANARL